MATYNKICYGGSDQCAVEYAVKAGQATSADSATSATSATSAGTAASASEAAKLSSARTIQTDLASSSAASFDGTANATPGVTGILPIANGGTGSQTQNFLDFGTVQKVTAIKQFLTGTTIYNDSMAPSHQAPTQYQYDDILFGSSNSNTYMFRAVDAPNGHRQVQILIWSTANNTWTATTLYDTQ